MSAVRLLTLAGRNGPAMLLGGTLVGVLVPALTGYATPFMGVAVFLAGTRLEHAGLVRLLVIVGDACGNATLLRHRARGSRRNNPCALTGIAVLGPVLAATGAVHDART